MNSTLYARIGSLRLGRKETIKVMGIINVSPESFNKSSIRISESEIASAASEMQECGAQIIDVGGMSTAPYADTMIPIEEEASRIRRAIKAVRDGSNLPVSADTPRSLVAAEAIRLGADAINDVTGLKYDPKMAKLVADSGASLIMGAYSRHVESGAISSTLRILRQSLNIAERAGIEPCRLIIDPSIGFLRKSGKGPFYTKMSDMPWYVRDLIVLSKIERIAELAPTCVSVSSKSFLGKLLNISEPAKRLIPSITCEVYAALHGASLIRTHNVGQTFEAVTLVQMLLSTNGKRL